MKSNHQLTLNGHRLTLTNTGKVYWPEPGYTKGDLMAYYDEMSKWILPYLKNRPLSLHRFPDGIEGNHFFQKNMEDLPPAWVTRHNEYSESEDRVVRYVVCNNKASLIYLVNLGCIEFHPWNARGKNPDQPDYMVFDLDPVDIDFKKVVEVALKMKGILDKLDINSVCKTSGKRGLHVMVPAQARYVFEDLREFARLISLYVHHALPEITSLERSPSRRQHKVYLDYLQNRRGQTMVAPYSLRPTPQATVSAPLDWKEVNDQLDPQSFTLVTMKKRMQSTGDLWKAVLGKGFDMKKALSKLEALK